MIYENIHQKVVGYIDDIYENSCSMLLIKKYRYIDDNHENGLFNVANDI